MENNKKIRKVNVGLALTRNFNKVTLEVIDEPIEFEDEIEFEREVKRLFNQLRGQVLIELQGVCKR